MKAQVSQIVSTIGTTTTRPVRKFARAFCQKVGLGRRRAGPPPRAPP